MFYKEIVIKNFAKFTYNTDLERFSRAIAAPLTHFLPISSFDRPENQRFPDVLRRIKRNIRKKWVNGLDQ